MTTAKLALAALTGCYALGEALPGAEPLGEFSKYGSFGLAVFLVWWVIAKTLPRMYEQMRADTEDRIKGHAENNRRQVEKLEETIKELRQDVGRIDRQSWQHGSGDNYPPKPLEELPRPPRRSTRHNNPHQQDAENE